MNRYPIDKSLGIFRFFAPPISKPVLALSSAFLKAPAFLFRDKQIKTEKKRVKSFDGKEIEAYIISPVNAAEKAPCLFYFHGGGFVFEGAPHHYRLPMLYAIETGCRVIYVKYRLAPEYKFPVPFEDCLSVVKWAWENSDSLGLDRKRMGVAGDSAGGTIAATVCHMIRDRGEEISLALQLLIYPFLDFSNNSESAKKYTDTPMWNSELTEKAKPMFISHGEDKYCSFCPVEADNFKGLPKAYIEAAQYDCLHDDAILYSQLLKNAGVPVTLKETYGTMHGFDISLKSPLTLRAVSSRVEFLKEQFSCES